MIKQHCPLSGPLSSLFLCAKISRPLILTSCLAAPVPGDFIGQIHGNQPATNRLISTRTIQTMKNFPLWGLIILRRFSPVLKISYSVVWFLVL
jgi:hypothetical protein